MKQNKTYQNFKLAIKRMYDEGEFDRRYRHKRKVRRIKENLEYFEEHFKGGIEGLPIAYLMNFVDDAEVLQTAIYYMGGISAEEADD